jgi:hypothetical protein
VIEAEIGGEKVRKENMIFPRYHQLDAVRKIGGGLGRKVRGTTIW